MIAQRLHKLMQVNEFSTPTYFAILELIQSGDQKLVILKQKLELSDAAVCDLIDKMVIRGLLTRAINPVDKRERLSKLTPQGYELLQQFYEVYTCPDSN